MNKYDRDPWHDAETVPLWLVVVFLVILAILFFCIGCTSPRIAATTDGRTIRYYPEVMKKLDKKTVDDHEKRHMIKGPDHCPNKKCLMYPVIHYDLIFGPEKKQLCEKCSPTTRNWIKKTWNSP